MESSAKGLQVCQPQNYFSGQWGGREGSESGLPKLTQLTRPEPKCSPEALTSQTAISTLLWLEDLSLPIRRVL